MAYNFNGTSQRLNTASTPVNAPAFSMACWFKPSTLSGGRVPLSICNTSGNSTTSRYNLSIRGNTLFAIQVSNAAAALTSTDTISPNVNAWNHGCGVFTSTASRTVYLNGANAVTQSSTNAPNTADINAVYIGTQLTSNSFVNYFEGDIAEVGIWNVALTAAEVASLAKGMTCDKIRPQNLVFYAPLVRNLQDAKGGLTITNNGGAIAATHPRVYA